MSEFCNLVYDQQFQQEENKHQGKGIDIVDFHTVGFYKDQHRPKRSLSLNIYEYEQTLGPLDCDKSSDDALKKLTVRSKEDNDNTHQSIATKKTIASRSESALLFCVFIVTLVVVYLVMENRGRGKYTTRFMYRIFLIKITITRYE